MSSELNIAIALVAALGVGEVSRRIPKIPEPFSEILIGVAVSAVLNFHDLNGVLQVVFDLGVFVLAFQGGMGVGGEAFSNALRRGSVVATVGVVGISVVCAGGVGLLGFRGFPLLFIVLAMVSTSIGVAARIFRSHNVYDRPVVHLTLAAALVDDFYGLIALVLISAIVPAGGGNVGSHTVLEVVGSLAIPAAILLLTKLRSTLMRRRVAPLVGVVLLALGAMAGVSPVILGFTAGLFVELLGFEGSKVVRMGEPLSSRTLVPGFFFLAGFGVIFGSMSLVVVGQLFLVLLVGLGASRFLLAVVSGLPRRDRLAIGFAMIPRAEVTLLILQLGVRVGDIAPSTYGAVVLIILVGLVVSSVGLERFIRD